VYAGHSLTREFSTYENFFEMQRFAAGRDERKSHEGWRGWVERRIPPGPMLTRRRTARAKGAMTNPVGRLVPLTLVACLVGCGADPNSPIAPRDNDRTGSDASRDGRNDVPSMRPEASLSETSHPSTFDAATSDAALPRPDATNDGTSGPVTDVQGSADSNSPVGWQLTWSDEFDGVAGTKPDPAKWVYDLGGGGWGVAQLQTYTSDAANAAADGNGHLAIVAIKTASGGYTSARLKTEGKFDKLYGRFEVRAKLPSGVGMWPAFWTLGSDFSTAGWPNCGEIDIMENRATEPTINHGSLHGPGYSGTSPLTATYTLTSGTTFFVDFHVFAIEWEENVVRFYVDDQLYETRTPMDLTTQKWVYEHPHFLLLNLAVGGRFPTNPDTTTTFPQTLLVDYVRVYSRAPTR
jgi:beta-glucanase (GH16 family)